MFAITSVFHFASYISTQGARPQRFGCHRYKMHVAFAHSAVILNHTVCCSKL